MHHSTALYVELYKRKEWDKIPILIDSNSGKHYYLTEKQIKTLRLLFDFSVIFVGYGGAARSGKTILECFWVMFNALSFPDTGWFLGRKELKRLRLTVLKSLLKVFKFYGLVKDVDYKYNQQDSVIIFSNKSEIFLLDLDSSPSDPEHLWTGGYEFTGGAIDESNECSESMIIAINARCGWRHNDTYNIPQSTLETFNPDKGHVNRRYWKPFRDKKEKEHERFVRALPTDNPHPLVKLWVKNMYKTGDKRRTERLVEGNFDYDDDPTRLFDDDCLVDMFTNKFIEHGTGYITIDVARLGEDRSVIMVWDGWVVTHIESYGKIKTNILNEHVERLAKKHKIPKSRIVADEDGVGGGIVDFGGYKGFVNNERAKKKENFFNLKSQCYFYIAKRVNNNEIYCKVDDTDIRNNLIEELEQMKDYNSDKDNQKKRVTPKEIVKEKLGRSPDYADAFMMREYFEVKEIMLVTASRVKGIRV